MRGLIGAVYAGLLIMRIAWAQLDTLAPRTEQNSPLDPQHDERLNRLITLRVPSQPLKELLQRLSRETGVRLLVEANIAEFRACLYAPNRPLHEVLHHLAEAFGYHWRRIDDENRLPAYRLIDPNPPSKAEAIGEQMKLLREMLPSICEHLRKPTAERRQALLSFIEQEGSRPPSTFSSEEEFKQWVKQVFPLWAGYSDGVGMWHALCRMSESEWQRLLNGEMLLFSSKHGSQVPQEAIQDWTEFVLEVVKERYERYKEDDEGQWKREWELAQQKFPQADEMRVSLRYDKEKDELYAGTVVFARGENIVPASMGNKVHGWPMLRSNLSYTAVKNRLTRRTEIRLPDHPAFQKPIEQFVPPGPWDDWFSWLGELLTQAAESTGIPLAAELYPFQPDSFTLYQWESLPTRQLDWARIAGLLNEWNYELNLSKQHWALVSSRIREQARANDIPQSQLAKWFYKPERRGVLTLEECAQLALLPEGVSETLYMYLQSYAQRLENEIEGFRDLLLSNLSQLHGGIGYARGTFVYFSSETLRPENRYILRLYGQLSPAQRQALRRGAEIPFESLPAPLQELFLQAWVKGSLLLCDDLWLPPAEQARRKSAASLRLTANTRWAAGIIVPDSTKRNLRSIQQFHQWWHAQQDKTGYWGQQAQQRRVWQFELRWGDQSRAITLEMYYPVELEPPDSATPDKSP